MAGAAVESGRMLPKKALVSRSTRHKVLAYVELDPRVEAFSPVLSSNYPSLFDVRGREQLIEVPLPRSQLPPKSVGNDFMAHGAAFVSSRMWRSLRS